MRPSRILGIAAALSLLPCLAVPGVGQTSDAGLVEALSLLSGGLLVPRDHPPEVTHDGDLYRVRVPLPALTTPRDASIDVVAKPLDTGVWDITALTLPPAGSLTMAGEGAAEPGMLTFSIGRQAFNARVDPSLAAPSPFKAEFGEIALRTEAAGRHTEQTIARYGMEGTLSGDPGGHLTIRALGTLANWLITGDGGQPGTAFSLSMRSATSRTEVDGLDRGQTERLRVAAQALSADRPAAVAGAPAGTMRTLSPSPDAREPLRAMIDALGGLLTRVDMDETILGVHFDAAGANTVDIGKIRLGLTCAARDGHVDADLDIAVSDLDVGMVPADYAAFVPRRITIRPAVSGVRTDALLQWLRGATAEGQDRAALSAQALALLIEPGARAGIETLVIESGPLRIEGSARVRPLPDGSAGFDVHLTATGLDPMIAAVQGTPKALQILPMAFLIKGMAKPQGDSLVWDIVFADGAATINGMPFGQPPAGAPPARR